MFKLYAYNAATRRYDHLLAEESDEGRIIVALNLMSRFYHDLAVFDPADHILRIRQHLDEHDPEAVFDLIPPIHVK